ncbi:MAG: TonB-dependent receptor [Candidatus Eremiobacteraeota bacterium]|nr:TonB-dependent receptor [Candidatus Eremiobacteraeota bacterium]
MQVFLRARAPAAAALIAFFALFSAFNPASADVTGLVRGTVTVDGSGRAGVTVTLRGDSQQAEAQTQTDVHGAFTFTRVPFGHYSVVAHFQGYPDATTSIQVAGGSVSAVALTLGQLHEIAKTTSTLRGVRSLPVSENTLGRATIDALPQQRSLNQLVETVPGIVAFSYDEPVAHGFHGLTYEVDGAPLPQATASNFSELIDPRNVDSLEILTGAFPAEYGGARMGAVVNITTKRDFDFPSGAQVSVGGGTYGTGLGSFSDGFKVGATKAFVNVNLQGNDRGLDAPTASAIHDNASLSDQFVRTITTLSKSDTLAFDFSNQFNTYQIPINLNAGPSNNIVNVPGTDDVQREYNSFANLNYSHVSRDGNGLFQIIPWWRYTRIAYDGDLPSDVLAVDVSPSDCAPAPPPCSLAGLQQDRQATYWGLRASYAHTSPHHDIRAGVDGAIERFTSAEQILQAGMAPFFDNVAQTGRTLSAYLEDKWTPSTAFSLQAGLRYDFSNGFVQGNELEPRIGANLRIAPRTVFHAYYGRIYAAPALEDTRRAAVVIGGGSPSDLPVYDLQPQHDSFYELGLAQTFNNGLYGYLTAWRRNAWNILDTTQIFPTPIFAVFNNAYGVANGLELRLEQRGPTASWFLSGTLSKSVAGGISGGTFLFPPSALSQTSLQPEDHDQTVAINDAFTKHFGADRRTFATLGTEYGTGYPVLFQDGAGRLLPHLTWNAAFGRAPTKNSFGYTLTALNFTNYQYLIKVNNGFNTTQWAPGAKILLQLTAAF